MKLTLPGTGGAVRIPPSGEPPPLPFASDAVGPHRWDWRVTWRDRAITGTATTPHGRWDARAALGADGGTLDVHATAGPVTA